MTTVAALALAGLLLAACGSDGDGADAGSDDVASASDDDTNQQDTSEDQADSEQELLDWVECMRDEGVDIPDPTRDADGNLVINGNGFSLGGGQGPTTNDAEDSGDGADEPSITPEQMEAGEAVCGQPPGLGADDISDEDLQAMQQDALEFAQCMRDEGIEDFPDPDFSDLGPGGPPQTQSNGPGGSDGDGRDDRIVLGPFGEIDLDDPETAAAFEACQDLLGGPPGEGGPQQSTEGATT